MGRKPESSHVAAEVPGQQHWLLSVSLLYCRTIISSAYDLFHDAVDNSACASVYVMFSAGCINFQKNLVAWIRGWTKAHNEQHHDGYFSPNINGTIKSRRIGWAGHAARTGDRWGAYRVLVGRPEGKKPLGRPRRRSEGNIKMDLQEIGLGGMDWIDLFQERVRWRALEKAVMKLRVP